LPHPVFRLQHIFGLVFAAAVVVVVAAAAVISYNN
jgi:hypothetical protein